MLTSPCQGKPMKECGGKLKSKNHGRKPKKPPREKGGSIEGEGKQDREEQDV